MINTSILTSNYMYVKSTLLLSFFSPLWEMVQEGIDIKTIKWTQHWNLIGHLEEQTLNWLVEQTCHWQNASVSLVEYVLSVRRHILLQVLFKVKYNIICKRCFAFCLVTYVIQIDMVLLLFVWYLFNFKDVQCHTCWAMLPVLFSLTDVVCCIFKSISVCIQILPYCKEDF